MDAAIQKLLKERYYLPHENTWEDIATRVSGIYPPIFDYINDKKFIPSTPTLMNANTNGLRSGTLSSCFTMGMEDSIVGIFDALKEGAIVTKASGGVGYDFSVLRSSKEIVKSLNRYSSGPIPFMRSFNTMLDGIQQGGVRRGAGMGMLKIDHPDILDVIRLKNNKGEMERLNISIKVTDEFYAKLKEDPEAIHIVYTKEGEPFPLEDNGKPISVKKLWDEIVEYAWRCAEPGIVNEDIARRQCAVSDQSDQILTNPCQPAFATILTPNGIKTIGDINVGDIIWSGKQWTKITKKWFTGNKQVNSYNTTVGSFIGTENHRIVQQGKKIEVKDANAIDICVGENNGLYELDINAVMDGLVVGDGSYHKVSNNLVFLYIGDNDKDYFTSEIKDLILKDRTSAFKSGWEVKTTITYEEIPQTFNREIPVRYYKATPNIVASFLRGLYSANGSIVGDRITLKQSSLPLIKQVQEMLSSLGIRSYYTTNKTKAVEFENGTYQCKESYDLNITKDRKIFSYNIGFIQKYKCEKLDHMILRLKKSNKIKITYDIMSIDDLGYHDVFDMTVEADEHTYWTGGLLVSNCSEFVNIPYASCNLGSINLTQFIVDGKFDWEAFILAIKHSTRFLNNIIDHNEFPLYKIKDVTLKIRPIGLGVMGYAHLLYLLDIPFNSQTAFEFSNKLFNVLTVISMEESIEIAKETGESYPAFNLDLYLKANARFISKDLKMYNDLVKYGTANSCNTSIAPTGSISYLCNTSGGIEPVFALTFSRRIEKLNREYETIFITDPIFNQYLVDNFDEKTKIKILTDVANNKGSCQKVQEIPEEKRKVFVVASDITPMEHLESLGIVARNTSLSVAKTVNMDSTATREEISEIYLKAQELGIIGVTVYRDGCRDGILVHSTKDDKEVIVKTNSPKRPKKLPCHVYRVNILNRVTNESEKWIIFVGLLDGDPYEIMAGKINGTDFDHNITEGEMVKIKREGKSIYQFCFNDYVLVDNVHEAYLNGLREYITRLMSWGLRHGAGIEYLREVLQKSDGTIVDFNKAVIRAINKYVKVANSKEKCPRCNSDLKYIEGCVKCSDPECSFAKCG